MVKTIPFPFRITIIASLKVLLVGAGYGSLENERAQEVHLGIFPIEFFRPFYKQAAAITLHRRINVFPRKHVAIEENIILHFQRNMTKLGDLKRYFLWRGEGREWGGGVGNARVSSHLSLLSLLNHYQIYHCLIITKDPGGTPLYRLYRYVRRQRVWFFSRLV